MKRRLLAALLMVILATTLMPQGISSARGNTIKIPAWHGIHDSNGYFYVTPSTTVIVYYIWFARTSQQVEDFKNHADITITLDGQPIVSPQAGVDLGWSAVESPVSMNVSRAQWSSQLPSLSAGTHVLQTTITLDAPVSDGLAPSPFPAGAVSNTTNMIVMYGTPGAPVATPNSGPSAVAPTVPTGELTCDRAVGTFVKDAVGYWGPDTEKPIQPELVMPAGKTLWVFGMDASHRFYQVLLDAQLFWVAADTIGPTSDETWHGIPLPNCVIQ